MTATTEDAMNLSQMFQNAANYFKDAAALPARIAHLEEELELVRERNKVLSEDQAALAKLCEERALERDGICRELEKMQKDNEFLDKYNKTLEEDIIQRRECAIDRDRELDGTRDALAETNAKLDSIKRSMANILGPFHDNSDSGGGNVSGPVDEPVKAAPLPDDYSNLNCW